MEAFAWEIGRVPQSICVNVSSAVAIVLPVGVFITTTPFSDAAGMSILSTPTPALPTAFNCFAHARTSAVILVSERTITASASFISSFTCSGVEP